MEGSAFTVVRPQARRQWFHPGYTYPMGTYPQNIYSNFDTSYHHGGNWGATNINYAAPPPHQPNMWQGFSCPPHLLQRFTPAFEAAVSAIYNIKMEWHVFREDAPNSRPVWCIGGDIESWGAAAVFEWWALNNPLLTKVITTHDEIGMDTGTTAGRKSLTMTVFQLGECRIYLAVCSFY